MKHDQNTKNIINVLPYENCDTNIKTWSKYKKYHQVLWLKTNFNLNKKMWKKNWLRYKKYNSNMRGRKMCKQ